MRFRTMRKLVMGILAHVDAGKTTLSESMLYLSGTTQELGRVDKKNAYLDTHQLERERGITIFSKQAVFQVGDTQITLLDTPGHVDFSTEMERTLQVLDYAILVISGADGVQGHTATLWRLLALYQVPVFLYVNKMDQPGTNQAALLEELQRKLDGGCVDFGSPRDFFLEQLACCSEELMEHYLETGDLPQEKIRQAVRERRVFPVYFGSALKLKGVAEFMQGLVEWTITPSYSQEFGARVFKISRDEQGNRLTHLKITGGTLEVRDAVTNGEWEEKVTQIRLYSGERFTTVSRVEAGTICTVTGLSKTRPGDGLGWERGARQPVLEPVLSYRITLPPDCAPRTFLPKLRELEEEEPELKILWDEQLQEIQAQLMGEVQIEILQSLIEQRFGVAVAFEEGKILYKETIASPVEGVGHFEPLRHYAEVQLLLEPLKRGSGLEFAVNCSEDVLARNWQRLILTHLQEKTHLGVLTGSPITDLKITLVGGRAHKSHTEGGDFREATYRAVRQGLMEAESILLEPYYSFRLEIPENQVGRAMTDIERMHGTWELESSDGETAILTGSAPVATMRNYHQEVIAFTRGLGRLFLTVAGYQPCHNPEEVIAEVDYDPERDLDNPAGSIFCAGGAGFHVPWNQVKEYMHLEPVLLREKRLEGPAVLPKKRTVLRDDWDVDLSYLETTANRGPKMKWGRQRTESLSADGERKQVQPEPKEHYLLVDGYNVIHAWPALKELAESNMDLARGRLLDALSSYQALKRCQVIAVFDAYRVQGRPMEEISAYHNIHVVYTKEAQTADQYIEKFAHDHKRDYQITVATSDALQQVIIRGSGSRLLSARELIEDMEAAREQALLRYQHAQGMRRSPLEDSLSQEVQEELKGLGQKE